MRVDRLTWLVALAAWNAMACGHPRTGGLAAHEAAGPGAAPVDVVWPRPPEAPRARRIGSATVARAAPRAGWWRRAARFIAGVSAADAAADALVRPFDVAVRSDGSFVLADPDRPAVLAFARDGAPTGELTCAGRAWGSPMSVAVAEDGAVWIADAAEAAVVRWTADDCRVLRPEGLERPTGIAVAGGTVAVADPPSHRLLLLAADGGAVAWVGSGGDAEGAFNFPSDVAGAPDGSFYVVDALNFRIVHLGADGRWLGAFGSRGDRGAGLARPKGVDVDAAGRVYVTDAHRDVALVFRADGALEYVLGEPGAEPGQLAHPAGISTRGDRLVVADSVNRRAEIFELLGEPR